MNQFVELRNWGLNVETVGFLGSVFFTTMSTWAQNRQYKELLAQPKKKGESLAPSWFVYGAAINVVTFIYGISTYRLALIYTGLLCVAYAMVSWKLYQYGKFGKGTRLTVMVGLGGVAAMLIVNEESFNESMLFTFLVGMLGWLVAQPIKLYWTKVPGSFRPEHCLVSMMSGSFWFIYGYYTGATVFVFTMPIMVANQLVTLGMWVYYGGDLRIIYRRPTTSTN